MKARFVFYAALAASSIAAASEGEPLKRRLFWGLDRIQTVSCDLARSQARNYAANKLGVELVSIQDCRCTPPSPDPVYANSLLDSVNLTAPHVWSCMAELHYREYPARSPF